uniref:Uncharacterized protein n=1 Tax=Romanomermis culicivorax TaxID=13658 RepID=A0A915IBH7_ROMCU
MISMKAEKQTMIGRQCGTCANVRRAPIRALRKQEREYSLCKSGLYIVATSVWFMEDPVWPVGSQKRGRFKSAACFKGTASVSKAQPKVSKAQQKVSKEQQVYIQALLSSVRFELITS